MKLSDQDDGSRIFGDRLYKYGVRGESQVTVLIQIILWMIIIYVGLIVCVAYNIAQPDSDTNKIMSRLASQNTVYGYVTMSSRYLSELSSMNTLSGQLQTR